jgi:hypothetical protein
MLLTGERFQIKAGSEEYPPDLETLVNGVDVGGKKQRFLRRIPIDPMTGSTDWGLRTRDAVEVIAARMSLQGLLL